MKQFRIGTDLHLEWRIQNYSQNSHLAVVITNPLMEQIYIDWIVIADDVAYFDFPADLQTYPGKYIATLWYNYGQEDQVVLDKKYAFELVQFSDQIEDDTKNIKVAFSSDIIDSQLFNEVKKNDKNYKENLQLENFEKFKFSKTGVSFPNTLKQNELPEFRGNDNMEKEYFESC